MLLNFIQGFYFRYIKKHLKQNNILTWLFAAAAFVGSGVLVCLLVWWVDTVFFIGWDLASYFLDEHLVSDSKIETAITLMMTFSFKFIVGFWSVCISLFLLYGIYHIKLITRKAQSWLKDTANYNNSK